MKEIYSILVILIGIIVGGYEGYNNLINKYDNILINIQTNTIAVEITQITMLKSIVRDFENNHKCKISDQEWEEYLLNYSTLFDLKIKHKILSTKANWKPIGREFSECKED